jgi:multiple sugar transport system permease protein
MLDISGGAWLINRFSSVGLIDSLFVLIVPALMGTSPFFVLVFYWTFRRAPSNLFDAARLDEPTFTYYWNDCMGSLIYLRSEALYTLSLRLQQFMTQDLGNQPLAMAAAVLAILPVLLLVLSIQRYLWSEDRS